MDPYQITFNTWNKVAALYADKFMNLDLYNDTYDLFCKLVESPNATILEVGCGPGNITKYISTKRPDFQIEAIDIAPNMIELAKVNNPRASFHVMDGRDIGKLESTYDGIVAGFCMPYLSKEDSSRFIRNCAELLVAGGIFYFSTIKGDYSESGFIAASTGDKSYVYFYSEDDLRNELVNNNFQIMDIKQKQLLKSNGEVSEDIIFIAKKR
jgi:2-polyprenyl-3-methyl-5-hydroxy-6-metoxy-1,4-benzoquinol methylase